MTCNCQIWNNIWSSCGVVNGRSMSRGGCIHRGEAVPIPDICHGYHGSYPWRKNLSCGEISNSCTWQVWGNLKFLHMWIKFTFLHITDVEKSEISLIMCTIYGILLNFTLFFAFFCNLRCFVVKSVCRDLRAVVWRKFDPKIVPVEKKWQIWGMTMQYHAIQWNSMQYHTIQSNTIQ